MPRVSKIAAALTASVALALTGCSGSGDGATASRSASGTAAGPATSGPSTPSAAPGTVAAAAYTIGVAQAGSDPTLDASVEGFKKGLADAGFTNVTYDVQNAADGAAASSIAQRFAEEDLDLVLGVATPTSQAVVEAITDTPIVFTAVTDPVGAGLVKDVKAPAANVTGVSDMPPMGPTIELIKQVMPGVRNLGVLYDASESDSAFQVEALRKAADALGINVVEATAAKPAKVQAATESLVGRVDALCVLGDATVGSAIETVATIAQQSRIPLFAADTDSVQRGAIAAYAVDDEALGEQAGAMAAGILSGRAVKDIPVQYAEKLQLSVNEAAARATGVTLPAELVAKAQNKF